MTEEPASSPGPAVGTRTAGRPRDSTVDERVLAVTRELLVEVGWDELSVRAVAARAGVGRATMNRRWTSKAELVLHAVLGEAPDLEPFTGTDRTGWIEWVIRGSRELFARPDVRAAVAGLLGAFDRDPTLREQLWRNFSGPAAALFVAHDTESGHAEQADLDARAIIALTAGAALFSSVVAADDTDALGRRVNELLLHAFTAY